MCTNNNARRRIAFSPPSPRNKYITQDYFDVSIARHSLGKKRYFRLFPSIRSERYNTARSSRCVRAQPHFYLTSSEPNARAAREEWPPNITKRRVSLSLSWGTTSPLQSILVTSDAAAPRPACNRGYVICQGCFYDLVSAVAP